MNQHLLLVMAGGALGAGARYLTGVTFVRLFGIGFPWGTLFVNVGGSFLIGVLIALAPRWQIPVNVQAFLAVGVLGGYTTFSTFSLDVMAMIERGARTEALAYILASVVLAVAGIFAGVALIRSLT